MVKWHYLIGTTTERFQHHAATISNGTQLQPPATTRTSQNLSRRTPTPRQRNRNPVSEFIRVRLTRQQVEGRIRRSIAAVLGRVPDPDGTVHGLLMRLGVRLLSLIQADFVTLSRGGTSTWGIKWAPLKPATIAQRRTSRAELKSLGITGRRVRGFLTPAEDRIWRRIFATRLAWLRAHGMSEGAAKGRAAAIAWTALKAMGAKTKLEVLGSRVVDVLRDTSELFRSLSPGFEDQPSNADGQIFQVEPGRVTVGTNKKPWHHAGNPARNLPARPFWPTDGNLPPEWRDALLQTLLRGLVRVIILDLQADAA